MIEVDPREPVVTTHARERFHRRSRQPRADVVESFRNAWPIVAKPWWIEGSWSYWLQPQHRIVFVVTCSTGRLILVTCLSVDGNCRPRNTQVAKAVAKWRKKYPRATDQLG